MNAEMLMGIVLVAISGFAISGSAWAIKPMRAFREKAGPGDVLIFTPELLSGTHYYARLFPCPDGKMTEESDRYTQALLYADIARRLFKEAFASG